MGNDLAIYNTSTWTMTFPVLGAFSNGLCYGLSLSPSGKYLLATYGAMPSVRVWRIVGATLTPVTVKTQPPSSDVYTSRWYSLADGRTSA